jgi:hypothetical protein
MRDLNKQSGSSPGNIGKGFAFSGGSPGLGSFMSHSGSSPTSPSVRPVSSVIVLMTRSLKRFSKSFRLAHWCTRWRISGNPAQGR